MAEGDEGTRVVGLGALTCRWSPRVLAMIPLACLLAFLGAVALFRPDLSLSMLRLLPFQLIPLGAEGSVPFLLHQGVPSSLLVAFLSLSDLAISVPILFLHGTMIGLPLIGRFVARMEGSALRFHTKHPAFQRFGALGLVLFVAIPLSGTGTMVGLLMGQITGLSNRVAIIAATAGTLIRWIAIVGGAAVVRTFA